LHVCRGAHLPHIGSSIIKYVRTCGKTTLSHYSGRVFRPYCTINPDPACIPCVCSFNCATFIPAYHAHYFCYHNVFAVVGFVTAVVVIFENCGMFPQFFCSCGIFAVPNLPGTHKHFVVAVPVYNMFPAWWLPVPGTRSPKRRKDPRRRKHSFIKS
jgi:hypothetical protein